MKIIGYVSREMLIDLWNNIKNENEINKCLDLLFKLAEKYKLRNGISHMFVLLNDNQRREVYFKLKQILDESDNGCK